MQVKDLEIDDEYISVQGSASVLEVSKKMEQAGMPDAVVLDSEGKLLGALDAYDIVSKVIAKEKNPEEVTAKEIMYAPPIVTLTTPVQRVYEIMDELDVSLIPVCDMEEKLLGVVTILDVLNGLAEQEARERTMIGKIKKHLSKSKTKGEEDARR